MGPAFHPTTTAHKISGGKWYCHPHLEYLSGKLYDVAAGRIKRLMVFMPPQHGKSTLVSEYFPTWFLGTFPERRVVLTSYNLETAARWGRRVRDNLEEYGDELFGLKVRQDSHAAHRWEIAAHEGSMHAVGVQGPLTGRGADGLIIDDPVKDAEEALSVNTRQKVWDWYESVAHTRLSENGWIILVMTRWHDDDLAGRLLKLAKENPEADQWDVVDMPAIAEKNERDGDWSRRRGQALAPSMFSLPYLQRMKAGTSVFWWTSLYQQHPAPDTGVDFKRETFSYWTGSADKIQVKGRPDLNAWDMIRFASVDLAAGKKEENDFMVVTTWALYELPKGWELYLLDIIREHAGGARIQPLVESAFERWELAFATVESNGMQLALVDQMLDDGLRVEGVNVDTSKRARALAATKYFEQGRVFFPKHHSALEIIEGEVLSFPRGDHDDIVDTISYGTAKAQELCGKSAMPPRYQTAADVSEDTGVPEWMIRNQRQAERGRPPSIQDELDGMMPR